MRIGIIGKGRVGSALQASWARAGHDVKACGRSTAPSAQEVAAWADAIVLAVPFSVLEDVADAIGDASGKPVIDCTNPIARGPEGLGLSLGHTTSGAEYLQTLLPEAHVIKSLNQVGAEVMAGTTGFGRAPVQFLAGNDTQAKGKVASLLSDIGFEPLDAGPLAMARLLEPFALVWINQAIAQGKGRNWAFGAMPREVGA